MQESNVELLMKAKLNSIGSNKKEVVRTSKKSVSKKLLISLFAVLLSISMCACSNNIEYSAVDLYRANLKIELQEIRKENSIERQADGTHSLEQYMMIKDYLREEDMIMYYDIFGKNDIDEISQIFGYSNFEDFLLKNNYVDEDGKASIDALRNQTYIRITKEDQEKIK